MFKICPRVKNGSTIRVKFSIELCIEIFQTTSTKLLGPSLWNFIGLIIKASPMQKNTNLDQGYFSLLCCWNTCVDCEQEAGVWACCRWIRSGEWVPACPCWRLMQVCILYSQYSLVVKWLCRRWWKNHEIVYKCYFW